MEYLKASLREFDLKVSRSTFGRVFRLDGSGHVSCVYLISQRLLTATYKGQGEKRCALSYRDSRWPYDFLYDGIYHRCQCE